MRPTVEPARSRHWVRMWRDPLIAGAVGIVLSLIAVGTPSIWFDEAATVSASTRSLGELWQMVHTIDIVHGAYYFGMHLVLEVVGYTPVTLRIPSAIAVGIAAAFVVVLARQLEIGRYPLVAGLVFCVLPRVTWMGIEGRSFAFTAMFAVIATVLLVRASRTRSVGWWIGYGAVAIVGCYLFLYLWLLIVAQGIAMIFWPHRSLPRPLVRWAIAAGLTTVAIAPLVAKAATQRGQIHWLEPLVWSDFWRFAQSQWFMDGAALAIAAWALIVLGIIAMWRSHLRTTALPIVLAGLVVPTVAVIVASVSVLPLYEPRYLTLSTPFVALGAAAGIAVLRARWMQALAVVVLAALAVPGYLAQRTPAGKVGTDWAAVATQIEATRDDAVPTGFAFGKLVVDVPGRVIQAAYPDAFTGMTDASLDVSAIERHSLWGTEVPLPEARLDGLDVLYVMDAKTISYPGWRVTDRWTYIDLVLTRLERDD